MRSQLASQFMPFFRLIARISTFRDKKYRILTFVFFVLCGISTTVCVCICFYICICICFYICIFIQFCICIFLCICLCIRFCECFAVCPPCVISAAGRWQPEDRDGTHQSAQLQILSYSRDTKWGQNSTDVNLAPKREHQKHVNYILSNGFFCTARP